MTETETIYATEVTELGPEVAEFLEADLMILFAEGAPPELAEISVNHRPSEKREAPPVPGDVLVIQDHELRITAIGEKAWSNVLQLGHAVFKFNGASEVELPGEIYIEEPNGLDLTELVVPGARIEIRTEVSG
ncbi:PTS glucitol/sorbitol transporter subunit IIA [Rubrobacter indicoceani]|uniref:PTS glucitol/sorbitol transporter subunit IIA n=1 Tax=Rubrobacter indicoceani TaxID=2051957 RepID=UPI000E5B1A9F|nr:PTS glucitol/sorbitol transporter subunit IIA [Rubrobacter indicoceani]